SRIGIAIDAWTLYQGHEEAARRAEEDARRTAVLQAMTAAMGRADSVQEVVDATLSEGVLAAGARAGVFALTERETGRVQIVGSRGFVQDDRAYWRSFSLDDPFPLAEAIREARPITVFSIADRRERYPDLVARDGDRDHVLVCLPVRTGQITLGGLAISFPEG